MKFIAFEGLDGSGKTTQINLLKEVLTKKYQKKVTVVQGLGSSMIGSMVREMFLSQAQLTPMTRIWLSLANMEQTQSEIIKPALSENHIVLADRWVVSTYAYQVFGHYLDLKMPLKKFNQLYRHFFFQPLITFYLKIDPKIGLIRKQQKTAYEPDLFEKKGITYFEQVQRGYNYFFKSDLSVKSYNAYIPQTILLKQIMTFLKERKFI
ncbi:dTMP kinase [Candidatus Phytoplasma oryzae]|nr:dTMP kinase [Candidatus Phytoplasma oryzae]